MPSSKKAKYYHKRQQQPDKFEKNTFKTVPFHHTNYAGKKYKKFHKKDSGVMAIVGKKKKRKKKGRWSIQSILIPKKKKQKKK